MKENNSLSTNDNEYNQKDIITIKLTENDLIPVGDRVSSIPKQSFNFSNNNEHKNYNLLDSLPTLDDYIAKCKKHDSNIDIDTLLENLYKQHESDKIKHLPQD